MEALAGESGLLPEQVWDSADIPERGLFIGHASGSAMPLVWAHAEYVKLCRSLRDGEIFDRPPQTVQRYLVEKVTSRHIIWRFNNKVRAMPPGRTLRVETLAPARRALERRWLAHRARYPDTRHDARRPCGGP